MANQELKDKLYKIVFGSETEVGKKFDVVLIIAIILSIFIVMCDSLFSRLSIWFDFIVLPSLVPMRSVSSESSTCCPSFRCTWDSFFMARATCSCSDHSD